MTTTPWQQTEPGNPSEPDFKNPVVSDYEGREGLAAPDQQEMLQQFIAEQEAEQKQREAGNDPALLAGKYKSPEELERAYKELESKLGQQQSQPERQEFEAEAYTEEAAKGLYGEAAVNSLAERGINMAELMQAADSGQDISEHFDVLAETFGVTRQVVENYVNGAGGFEDGAEAQPVASELTEADTNELKEMVGGEERFNQISQWAAKNLTPDALREYNEVVDKGDKMAIKWALRALYANFESPKATVEPKLYGGGDAPGPQVFESQQQLLEAMNRRNSAGQIMYEVDEAYRQKVVNILAKSKI